MTGENPSRLAAREAATIQRHRTPDQPTIVAVVDDHPAIVASIADAIDAADDMLVAGTARTFDEAVTLLDPAASPRIDVLLLDIQLADGAEGLRLLSMLTERSGRGISVPSVIILSGFDQPSLIRAAFERGAAGYVAKTSDLESILDAIRVVASGGTAYTASAVGVVRSAPRRPSDREIQVIGLVSAGASNAEAGAILDLSEKTIESHLRRLFDRYGVLSRTELAVLAIREGWVSGSSPAA